ncbi:MAG: hypothetical protein II861_02060 [Methanomicrobium sp.]|nr:hypothetical protein [Methanomicrobium sp.]
MKDGKTTDKTHDDEIHEIKEMLGELLWLNSVIATELIQITENSSQILRKADIPETCRIEHGKLRAAALDIAERYKPNTGLKEHLLKHQ